MVKQTARHQLQGTHGNRAPAQRTSIDHRATGHRSSEPGTGWMIFLPHQLQGCQYGPWSSRRHGTNSRAVSMAPGHADSTASAPGLTIRPLVKQMARHQIQGTQGNRAPAQRTGYRLKGIFFLYPLQGTHGNRAPAQRTSIDHGEAGHRSSEPGTGWMIFFTAPTPGLTVWPLVKQMARHQLQG